MVFICNIMLCIGKDSQMSFVAINYITCVPEYKNRFEELFASRAGEIDKMPGFVRMSVLRPHTEEQPYLIVSEWVDQSSFNSWMKSPAFVEGHKRGFADITAAKEAGKTAPMTSKFQTYEVITR